MFEMSHNKLKSLLKIVITEIDDPLSITVGRVSYRYTNFQTNIQAEEYFKITTWKWDFLEILTLDGMKFLSGKGNMALCKKNLQKLWLMCMNMEN